MIVQNEVTPDQVYDIVNELLAGQDIAAIQADVAQLQLDVLDVQADISDINTEQVTQNNRLTALESQTYPEAFRNLSDVDVTLGPSESGKIVKYDYGTDNFVLATESPGVLNFNQLLDVDVSTRVNDDIVIYNQTSGIWENSNRFANLETQTTQIGMDLTFLDSRVDQIDLDQVTQNTNIQNLQTDVSILQTQTTQLTTDLADLDT